MVQFPKPEGMRKPKTLKGRIARLRRMRARYVWGKYLKNLPAVDKQIMRLQAFVDAGHTYEP